MTPLILAAALVVSFSSLFAAMAFWLRLKKSTKEVQPVSEEVSIDAMSDAADLFWQTDRAGMILAAGGRLMPNLVNDINEIVGRHYLKTIDLEAGEMSRMLTALEAGNAYSDIHSRFKSTDGAEYIISLSGTPRYNKAGKIIGYFGLGTDVTTRVAAQDELKFLAEHDALTGLANRRAFETRMEQLLEAEDRKSFAIFAMDLDGFKPVNDQYGHDVGDEILRAVASRIGSATRGSDWAARLGGDEFVVVGGSVNSLEGAAVIAERLVRVIREPFSVGGQTILIGASIGVTLAGEGNQPIEDLMKQADEALYEAKASGKSCYRFYGRPNWQKVAVRLVR
ncbi:MAG: sensor domain-containing diguanylate cyclase [Pseudomonadota bacterium]